MSVLRSRARGCRTRAALSVVIGLTFLWAAIAKSASLNQFATVIEHLSGASDRDSALVQGIALGVILWEATLAGMLLTGIWSRHIFGMCIGTLLVLSIVLVRLHFHPAPITCGCFGFPRSSLGPREDSMLGLARNGCLLVVCAWLCLSVARQSSPHPQPGHPRPLGSRTNAFTLIELLVVIVVISLLIALALGALGLSKKQAKTTKSLAIHQQLVAAISMYAGDSREFFPYIGTPGDPNGPLVADGFDLRDGLGGASYFSSNMRRWTTLIVPNYWSAQAAIETPELQLSDEISQYPDTIVSTNFMLAHGCSAVAAYWDDEFAPFGEQFFRGSTQGDVRFPSAKGLLWDAASREYFARSRDGSGRLLYTTARADGSAGTIDLQNPQGDPPVSRPHGATPFPVLSTRHGLAGRDF